MKKSTLLFTTLCLIMTFSFQSFQAQETGSNLALPLFSNVSGNSIITLNNKDNKAIGSPYLTETFMPAKISAMQNETYKVRYNAYNDEIEVMIDEDNIQNFNKNMKGVVITMLNDDLKFTSVNLIDGDNGVKPGYLVSLTDNNDKVKLFSKKEIKYYEARPAKTSYDNDRPAEFKNVDDTYFVSINDGYARELPSNKKDLAKLFPKNSKDVLNFIKKKRIKTSKEQDLIQLINYVNSL
ncbi:hypothetical protein [Psychroserpens sp. Hel_I_66]|uniref:hypothetical protein n=1 Tax=Psychroserpens sp. Hel_I_66 TaxID=1250004 RepID=UPI000A54CD03|nr:hypothetical protein [Psychroserpens sp. Hel_I_66]